MRPVGHAGPVLGCVVASVLVSNALPPAVIDHHFVAARRLVEQPSQQFCALPALVLQVPFSVAENQRRPVAADHILELGNHVLLDVAVSILQPERVEPLVERVVEPHLEPGIPDRTSEVSQQVAAGPFIHAVPRAAPSAVGILAGPEREAVVMFGGQHHVAGAGLAEEICPLLGIEQLCLEFGGELPVGELLAIDSVVEFPRRQRVAALALVTPLQRRPQRMPIPF